MSNTAKLTLAPQTIEGSTDVVKGMLEAVKSQTGFVPNMYANMANLPGLLDTYQAGYKHFREDGIFTSVEQEVVLLTVSRFNACTYCMAAHSMIASKVSHVPEDVLKALRSGAAIPDPALAVLSSFTEVMLRQRGNPSEEQLGQFRAFEWNSET